jgi:WD40 repeat protein
VWTTQSGFSDRRSQAIAMSSDGKFLAVYGTSDGDISIPIPIFDSQSGRLYTRLKHTLKRVTYLSFRSNGRQVLLGDQVGQVELWDLDSRTCMWKSRDKRRVEVVCIASSQKDDLVAWLDEYDGGLLDAVSGDEITREFFCRGEKHAYIAWAADGTQLLTSHPGGNVRIWDVISARSTRNVDLLFQIDTSHYTTFCSFFDNHRFIATDHGLFSIPPQHRPACAVDDQVPLSLEKLLRLRPDGWVWQVGETGDRRVCWLPPTYRSLRPDFARNIAVSRDKVVLVTDSGRLVVIDFQKWFKNADSDL